MNESKQIDDIDNNKAVQNTDSRPDINDETSYLDNESKCSDGETSSRDLEELDAQETYTSNKTNQGPNQSESSLIKTPPGESAAPITLPHPLQKEVEEKLIEAKNIKKEPNFKSLGDGYSENISEILPSGSIGWEILDWLKKKRQIFSADIHQLLSSKKAFLILPAAPALQKGRKLTVNRPLVEEHVVVASSPEVNKPLRTLAFTTIVIQENTLFALESNVKLHEIDKQQHQPNFLSLFGNPITKMVPECVLDGVPSSVLLVRDGLISLPPDYIKAETMCDSLLVQFEVEPGLSRELAKRTLGLLADANEGEGFLSELQEIYNVIREKPDAQDFLEKWICDHRNLSINQCLNGEDVELEKRFASRASILSKAGIQLQQLDPSLGTCDHLDVLLEAVGAAGKIMATLNGYSSPGEKLHALVQAQDLLARDMDADSLLPLLIYTLIYHPPESLMAQLRFIQAYRRPGGLDGAAGYCITNLVAAIAYIDTFDLPSLGIFDETIDSAPKDSPSSTSSFSNSLRSLSTLPMDVTGEGVRALTGVMDMVVGRFWSTSPRDPPPLPPRPSNDNCLPISESLIPRNESMCYFFKSKFVDSDFESLSIAELRELLEDYKSLNLMLNN